MHLMANEKKRKYFFQLEIYVFFLIGLNARKKLKTFNNLNKELILKVLLNTKVRI